MAARRIHPGVEVGESPPIGGGAMRWPRPEDGAWPLGGSGPDVGEGIMDEI